MKMQVLRILSLLLALCLLAGSMTLTACSTPDGENDTTDGGSLGESETAEDPRATLLPRQEGHHRYRFHLQNLRESGQAGDR